MKTYALIASIVIALAATARGDSIGPIYTIQPLHVVVNPNPIQPVLPSTTSTVGVIRLIHVTVSPAMPTSSDPVSVAISLQASSAYLALDNATVNKQGSDIAIDLYWSDHPPVTMQPMGSVQACSLGYGIEQVNPTPLGIQVNKTYQTTEQLGTFSPGTYQISLHCHGAIEGEASAMFQVRDPIATPGNPPTLDLGGGNQPANAIDAMRNSIPTHVPTFPSGGEICFSAK